ncbi:hypothetical protein [Nitrososphaera sp.]|uniref:hypothetical protein n=1 Tax=Nitrososphaera sp. TaxID=1971748 RepID=UPI002EDB79AC
MTPTQVKTQLLQYTRNLPSERQYKFLKALDKLAGLYVREGSERVRYKVVAIHPGIYHAGNTDVSREILKKWTPTLNNSRIKIDHNEDDSAFAVQLQYPDNRVVSSYYDDAEDAVITVIELADTRTDVLIRAGILNAVSVEMLPFGAFTGLSLLTNSLRPADKKSRILRESRAVVQDDVPNIQLRCKDCGKLFEDPTSLQNHYAKDHNPADKEEFCLICGRPERAPQEMGIIG